MQQWSTCSLSGEQIETPVASKLSGHIFEKRLIEKHVESTSTCPITGRPMCLDDLIHIKVHPVQRPRPLTATSVPQLLSLMQNEWDALLLEQFQLKQHLETVRQELTHALYQHDAACRVIARVIKDRDQARIELAQLQERMNSNGGKMETEVQGEKLPEQIVLEVEDTAVKLNNMRKQRRKQADWINQYPSPLTLSNYSVKTTLQVEKATTLDVHREHDHVVLVGNASGEVQLLDTQNKKVLAKVSTHHKKITALSFIYFDEHIRFITCSEDGHSFVHKYEEPGKINLTYQFQASDAIVGCAVHPVKYLVIVASKDGVFTYHDVQQGIVVSKVNDFKGITQLNSIAIHPDGHFVALGSADGTIRIWKVSAHQLIAQLEGHKGDVSALCFSETGTILASASQKEGVVNIWNLRTSEIIKTLFKDHKQVIGSIHFDESAQFLAVGSQETIYLIDSKKWDLFSKITGHKDLVTGVKFGNKSRSIVTCSSDNQVMVYSD